MKSAVEGLKLAEEAGIMIEELKKEKEIAKKDNIKLIQEKILNAITKFQKNTYILRGKKKINNVIIQFYNLYKDTGNELILSSLQGIKEKLEQLEVKKQKRYAVALAELKKLVILDTTNTTHIKKTYEKQQYSAQRKLCDVKTLQEDSDIINLITKIDEKALNLCVRTIHLPGLGSGQQMGSKHKVLEVYQMNNSGTKPDNLLFSVGGKLRIEAERHDGRMELYQDEEELDYYMEFPDQFLECDKKYKEIEPSGNLFIDDFTSFEAYKKALQEINKGHHVRDIIGEHIAKELYKVDNGKINKSEFEILQITDDKAKKEFIKKLLFILLIDRNRISTSDIRGNFVDSDEGRVILELEDRGVYGYYDAEKNLIITVNIIMNFFSLIY